MARRASDSAFNLVMGAVELLDSRWSNARHGADSNRTILLPGAG